MVASVFVPQDAYLLQNQVFYATECGQSEYFVDRHFFAIAHATAAVALSIINCPLYLIRAVGDLFVNTVQLDFKQMGSDLRDDLLGASQSFMMVTCGSFYLFAGLFFPRQVFGFFTATPRQPDPVIPYSQYAQEHEQLQAAQDQIREFEHREQILTHQLGSEQRASRESAERSEQLAETLNREMDELRRRETEIFITPAIQSRIDGVHKELQEMVTWLQQIHSVDDPSIATKIDEFKKGLTDFTSVLIRHQQFLLNPAHEAIPDSARALLSDAPRVREEFEQFMHALIADGVYGDISEFLKVLEDDSEIEKEFREFAKGLLENERVLSMRYDLDPLLPRIVGRSDRFELKLLQFGFNLTIDKICLELKQLKDELKSTAAPLSSASKDEKMKELDQKLTQFVSLLFWEQRSILRPSNLETLSMSELNPILRRVGSAHIRTLETAE